MPEEHVQLDRCFLPVRISDEGDALDPWSDPSDIVFWDRVLEERCAVILGEARTGKTTEFRSKQAQLVAAGKPAFFLPTEDLAAARATALFTAAEDRRFDAWASGDSVAYFFLDAVDEARLRSKSLRSALRNLERDLRGKFARSRILISCRVSDWRSKADVGEIQSTFSEDGAVLEVKVFTLTPLVDQQVVMLANHYRVEDVGSFINEIRQAGAYAYLERPGDVFELVTYWREHKTIGTYSQLIASNVERKLREFNDGRSPSLTPAKAKLIATSLAGLALLQRKTSFVLRDGSLDPDRAATSLDPHTLLPDLGAEEISELLALPLFDEATYGRVRIHHRSVSEYLAAGWLASLLQRRLDPLEIERLLFQETPDGRALPPELAQVAAWLAAESPQIRDRVLAVAPLVLLEGGDPNALPNDTKRALLNRLAEQYQGRQRLFKGFDRIALRRLATSSIADTVNQLLAAPDHPVELLETLLGIVIEGSMGGCAAEVTAIAVNPARPAEIRAPAIEAVNRVGLPADREAAIGALLGEQGLELRVVKAAVDFLYPTPLDVSRLLELMRRCAPPRRRDGSLSRLLDGRVYDRTPVADRPRLLSGVLALVQDPPSSDARNWLIVQLARLVIAYMRDIDDEVLRRALTYLDEVFRGPVHQRPYDFSRVADDLTARLEARSDLRRFLFWERAARTARDSRKRPTRYYDLPVGHAPLWRISVLDLDWLERDAESREHVADKLLAFDAFLSAPVPEEQLQERHARADQLATNHPALKKRAERRLRPAHDVHPGRDRAERELRLHEKNRQRYQSNNVAWLQEHLEQIRSGELHQALVWLWHQAPSFDDGELETAANELSTKFGVEIAQAAEEGWRCSWRSVACPLPHEKAGRSDVVDEVMIGLAGISSDLAHGLDLSSLSESEATQAARLATHSMNRFPPWVEVLVREHKLSVQAVFEACIRADYVVPFQLHVLGLLAGASRAIQQVCAPVLGELIEARDPADPRVLDQVLAVLLVLPEQRALPARLAPVRCTGNTAELARFAMWWAVWFVDDPDAAVECLAAQIRADSDRASDRVLAICDRIASRLEPHQRVKYRFPDHASGLASLLAIVLAYARPSDDIDHVDAHAIGSRDHAERLRDLLVQQLAEMPGRETVDALLGLANDPRWPEWRDWLRSLAEKRRDDDLTIANNDVGAKLIKAYQTHGLAAPAHLAEAGLRVVRTLSDHEHAIAELRAPMQKHTILFLAANSIGTNQLALDREARAIQHELERGSLRDRFELVTRWAVQSDDLLHELRRLRPTVVHFSGHGGPHAVEEQGQSVTSSRDILVGNFAHNDSDHQHGLFLQGPDGRPRHVSTDAIKETFGALGDSIKLVVLNACYSEAQAEALVAHVDCIIGMRDRIGDDAALAFSVGFYGGLVEGESVAAAFAQGSAALSMGGYGNNARPQMKSRAGFDAARFVLAATPSNADGR